MLLYHPYKDSNHCTFRILSIMLKHDNEIPLDKLKILDFFYLFPHFLKEIKPWPRDLSAFKKYLKDFDKPFENTPNKKKLFFDMENVQNQALMQLASRGIMSVERLKKGFVKLDASKLPEPILEQINNDDFNGGAVLKILVEGLCNSPWSGSGGLKMRSGLMEYKYDE